MPDSPDPRTAVLSDPRTEAEPRDWLVCSSCNGLVPERDATVVCIECGEAMTFTANAEGARHSALLAEIEGLPDWHQEDGCEGGHDYAGAIDRVAVIALIQSKRATS